MNVALSSQSSTQAPFSSVLSSSWINILPYIKYHLSTTNMRSIMSAHDVTPMSPIRQIEGGSQNVSVNAGQSTGGSVVNSERSVTDALTGLLQRDRGMTTADTTNNTLAPQCRSTSDGSNDTRIDVTPVSPIRQIEGGSQNVSVNAGQSTGGSVVNPEPSVTVLLTGWLQILRKSSRGMTTADATNNTLAPQCRSTSDGSNDTRIDVTPVSPIRQIELGSQNVSVNAGTSTGGSVVNSGRWGTTADTIDNTLALQRHSTFDGSNNTHIDVGTTIPTSPGTAPGIALQPQSTSDKPLTGNMLLSQILAAGCVTIIVAFFCGQIPEPNYPYRWTPIAVVAVQSIALGAMMMGFYLQATNKLAAIWSHRIGHVFFLEGIALAGVWRFHWPLRFIPLVLLPVPAVLIPFYMFVDGIFPLPLC